ncbi:MAG: protein TonB [Flavobacteriales bacterium]|jgi:protein TonB
MKKIFNRHIFPVNLKLENIGIISVVILVHVMSLTLLVRAGATEKLQNVKPPVIQGILLPTPVVEVLAQPADNKKVSKSSTKKNITKRKVDEFSKSQVDKGENIIPIPIKTKTENDYVNTHPPLVTQKYAKKQSQKADSEVVSAISIDNKKSMGAPLTPPKMDANPLNNPAPAYPKMSRRLGEKGTVVLEILIKANGSVAEVRLKKTSGFARLDKTAISAIKRWRYQPAMRGDKAVEYWYQQALEFILK